MAELAWTILCTRASIDSLTNNLSLFEILEQVQVPEGAANMGIVAAVQWNLVSMWRRSGQEPERAEMRVRLLDPTGTDLHEPSPAAVVDLVSAPRARIVGTIVGMPLRGFGLYQFQIETRNGEEWRASGSVGLLVEPQQAPAPTANESHTPDS
ncbi:hypothetical protein BH11MYX4_BH11MYX4_03870 [soil metagenome]